MDDSAGQRGEDRLTAPFDRLRVRNRINRTVTLISEILIPNLGATGGTVIFEEWRAAPGDYIAAGNPIFVVTTDKATVEVEAFKNGYLRKTFAAPGDEFYPGDVVGLLSETPEEPLEDSVGGHTAGPRQTPSVPRASGPGSSDQLEPAVKERILASPLARRMAAGAGLDLRQITGSGRRGEILRRDIEQAIAAKAIHPVEPPPAGPDWRGERLPVSGMRRSIAERTRLSKTQIPHFYASLTIDMEAARSFLESAARYAQKQGWQPPTITDVILRATALTLRDYPQVNASFEADTICYHNEINIGLVVGLEEGLIIPVIRRADEINLYTLAALTTRLKAGAKQGTLRASDLSGATFTLSNLGMYGLDSFIAVINPPEAGVLAVGAVRQVPAVWDDKIVPRWQMEVVVSVDHRIVDGVVAARFLAALKERLEDPFSLALEPPVEAE